MNEKLRDRLALIGIIIYSLLGIFGLIYYPIILAFYPDKN